MPAPAGPFTVTIGNIITTSVDSLGVEWIRTKLDGWWGAPGGTLTQGQKTRQRGAWSGRSDAKARPIVLAGTIIAPTPELLSDAFDRLNDACSLDETLLTVAELDRSRWAIVRRDGDVIPVKVNACTARYSVQFAADDSRKLGTPLTGSTALPSSSGGLVIPYTVPYTIPAVQVSGQVHLFNAGNETGPVLARLVGPLIGPVLTHIGSGLRLVFAASATIGVGEFWDVDMEAHTVMAQGQSSRAQWITSRQWSGFESGNNTWALTAASATSGSVIITATPADK